MGYLGSHNYLNMQSIGKTNWKCVKKKWYIAHLLFNHTQCNGFLDHIMSRLPRLATPVYYTWVRS